MGRLLGLELSNFKSYKGTVKVGFGDANFTSIIGPNGSGKSNMMDAISFVLGVRSSHLRSHLLMDLVYRGRRTGDEEESMEEEPSSSKVSSTRSAYVKAFYLKEGEENPIEFMRTISRSGESAYKVNGKTVGYKDYSDILEKENILIKARNFLVFQGDVEQIASQSAGELTKLFEQISGSVQYKREYEILNDEYKAAAMATADSLSRRKRIHAELKQYKEGVVKDEQYKGYAQDKKKLQKNFALWELYHLERKRNSLIDELQVSKSKLSDLKGKLSTEENLLQRSKGSFAKEELAITKYRSKLTGKRNNVEKLTSSLLPVRSSKQATTKRIANIERRIESLQRDIDRQTSYVENFEHQLKVVTKTKNNFQNEIEESSKNFNKYILSPEDLRQYEHLKEMYLSSGGSNLEEKINVENNNKQEFLEEIDRFQKRIDISKSRTTEELNVEYERLNSQASDTTQSLNDKNTLLSRKIKDLKELQSKIESTNSKEYELNYKLREVLVKLDDLSANQRETNKERKLRENVATLKRLFPGVRGLVHDLCHPKKDKYAVAVSTVLGKNFDSVIVDNFSVAQECISYLKKQRSGVASFIPLDTIDVITANLPVSNTKGCILAIDSISYDSELEKAMQYVCSDSIICDSLDLAKDLKWNRGIRSKLVTLEGALIHKAGLMTGGASREGNNRWDKEEYQGLLALKNRLTSESTELISHERLDSAKARELENEISVLNTEISGLRTQLNQVQRSLKENKVEIQYHEDMVKKEYIPKIDSLRNKAAQCEARVSQFEHEKETLQERIYKGITEKLGFSIKEYEQHSGEIMRKQAKELQQLQKQIMNIKNKLEFENERLESTRARHEKSTKDLEKVKEELKSLESEEAKILDDINKLEDRIAKDNEELVQKQIELDKKSLTTNSLEETIVEISNSMQMTKREYEELKEDIEKLTLERVNTLKNCKITNIDLPVRSSSLEDLPMDKIDSATIEIANSIDIDYTKLTAKYKESNGDLVRQDFQESLKKIEHALLELQPNSKAVERYEETQMRYDVVNGETESLKAKEKKIREQYLKVKQSRREMFEKAYNHVSDHIDQIYRELTKDPHSTAALAGGSASLTLEDEDEPYLAGIKYHATPPMKRFKDMEHLSGGEKTVAALALLFAINSYQPSPFFVLDEVDAALDNTNVEKIATYIKRHANPNFQFIVISLKNSMFEKSQALVGVFRQQQENTSKVITLDLDKYAD